MSQLSSHRASQGMRLWALAFWRFGRDERVKRQPDRTDCGAPGRGRFHPPHSIHRPQLFPPRCDMLPVSRECSCSETVASILLNTLLCSTSRNGTARHVMTAGCTKGSKMSQLLPQGWKRVGPALARCSDPFVRPESGIRRERGNPGIPRESAWKTAHSGTWIEKQHRQMRSGPPQRPRQLQRQVPSAKLTPPKKEAETETDVSVSDARESQAGRSTCPVLACSNLICSLNGSLQVVNAVPKLARMKAL
jgi:hypothetical protein